MMRTLAVWTGVCAVAFGTAVDFSAQGRADGQAAAPVPVHVRAVNERFAGVWKLVGEESRDATGELVPIPSAALSGRIGYITYDPAGYMGVVLAWVAQPRYAARPTPEEAQTALTRYNSYWGSFTINESAGVVTHQTFGALMPSFAGTNQERRFTITGNRLSLRPPAAANGDQRTLTWERVPDLPTLTPTHRKLIGFWKLIGMGRRNAKGETQALNPGQTGFIVYTASGHVMVHLMQPYRRRNVGVTPTPDETLATYRSYTSYFGPYTVNESGQFLTHHLDAAFNATAPAGSDFQRFYEFSANRLTLKTPPTKDANGNDTQLTITWERLSTP